MPASALSETGNLTKNFKVKEITLEPYGVDITSIFYTEMAGHMDRQTD